MPVKTLRALSLLNAPVAVGVVVMAIGGAAVTSWATQLVAAGIGVALFFAAHCVPEVPARAAWALAALASAALAATLMAPGLDGVHRWFGAAGLRLHVSQLATPTLLVFVAGQLRRRPVAAGSLLLALQVVHSMQPDAAQASAVAVAALLLRPGKAVTATVVALAVASWWRPDPLGPSAFVEDIMARAFAVGPWLGALAVLALLGAALAFVGSGDGRRRAGVAMAGYLATAVAVACTERFPVPLLGYGASSVLGLSMALAVGCRRPAHASVR